MDITADDEPVPQSVLVYKNDPVRQVALKDLVDVGNVELYASRHTGHRAGEPRHGLDRHIEAELSKVAALLRDAKARLAGGASGSTAAQEKTDFSELSASWRITDGVARNDDLNGKSPLLRLGGSGTIYLPEDRLDYTLKATVVPTLQGQGGPELEQLRGLSIPVRISGPYQQLGWQLDLGATALGRAREQLDERKVQLQQETQRRLDEEKAKAQQRLQQQAEDRLKQLLGR